MNHGNTGTLEAMRRAVKRQLARERNYPHSVVILRSMDDSKAFMYCANTDKAVNAAELFGFVMQVESWHVTPSGAVIGPRYA